MKKGIVLLMVCIVLSCLLCGCNGLTSAEGGSDPAKAGAFTGVGGWRAEEGVVLLLEDGGSGGLLSEVKMEGDASNINVPDVIKTEITWNEDDETVKVKAGDNEYTFQKKKDGVKEWLELNGFTYARLDEDELKEYKEKAASANAAGQTHETSDTRNEELTMNEPIIIIDNDKVNVKVTRFFREVFNEGKESEFVYAGFEIEAENKMDGYDISLYPRDCSLSDRHVIEFSAYGNSTVAPGKIATMKFVRLDNKDFENLDVLYELEGNLDMSVRDDKYSYSDLGGKLAFSIPEALNAGTAVAENLAEGADAAGDEGSSAVSEEEIDEQLQGEWVLNAGNGGTFYFDEGKMTVESNEMTLSGTYDINIEKTCIDGHFKSNEGKDVTIHMPYKFDENGNFVLLNNANDELIKK